MTVTNKTKKVPKLRSRGFSDEWREQKLGDIAQFSKGANISKDDITPNGKTEAIRYGELYTTYGEVIDEIKSKTDLSPSTLVLSKANDVIIPASGETHIDIATASCVLKDGVALGGDINIIRSDNNGVFLAYYLSGIKKHDIARLGQGVSVVHLYAPNLKQLKLNLPSLKEQQKIASFMSAIDNKISALQNKKKRLEQYKKSSMQAIFSQKVRFEGFSEKWQEKKLGDITSSYDSKRRPISREKRTSGGHPYYGANGVVDYVHGYIFNGEYILVAEDGVVDVNNYPVHIARGKFWANNHTHVLQSKGTDNTFLFYALQSINFTRYITGSAQSKLNGDVLSKVIIYIPAQKEQEKIADFLTVLDDKIDLMERQLEQAKLFKKALLQQTFV